AVCLTIQRFLPLGHVFAQAIALLANLVNSDVLLDWSTRIEQANYTPIGRLFFWCLSSILTYFVIPIAVIRFFLRERMRDYGLKLQGAFAGFWIYIVMLGVMLPLVALISADEHFQRTYPFYPLACVVGVCPT